MGVSVFEWAQQERETTIYRIRPPRLLWSEGCSCRGFRRRRRSSVVQQGSTAPRSRSELEVSPCRRQLCRLLA